MATIIDGSLTPRGKKISFPNGMEWYESNVSNKYIYDIKYANGLWLATSGTNGIYGSSDGKNWSQDIFTGLSVSFSLCYADGLWVSAGTGLYYSTDGKSWSPSNITSVGFRSVHNANGIWIAGSSDSHGLYYSTDGKKWTQSNITSGKFSNTIFKHLIYNANGIWVAGACDSNLGLYYSINGMNWTHSNISSIDITCVNYANGIWEATSTTTGVYYSLDGKSWTLGLNVADYYNNVQYGNGLWVASSDNHGTYSSFNGKNWVQGNLEGTGIQNLNYANGIWIAERNSVGSADKGILYSFDGKNWVWSNITSGYRFSLFNANGMWVAGNQISPLKLLYSPTWEVSTPPRTVSEEWVLKSSVTASPLTIPGESGFLTLPLEADFSSGLTAYDKFVLVEDGSSSLSLGDHFTV